MTENKAFFFFLNELLLAMLGDVRVYNTGYWKISVLGWKETNGHSEQCLKILLISEL